MVDRPPFQIGIGTIMVAVVVVAMIAFLAGHRLAGGIGAAAALGIRLMWSSHAHGRQRATGQEWDEERWRVERRWFYGSVYMVLVLLLIGVLVVRRFR
jgi:hypothetical protein